jgi:hypothetical protein
MAHIRSRVCQRSLRMGSGVGGFNLHASTLVDLLLEFNDRSLVEIWVLRLKKDTKLGQRHWKTTDDEIVEPFPKVRWSSNKTRLWWLFGYTAGKLLRQEWNNVKPKHKRPRKTVWVGFDGCVRCPNRWHIDDGARHPQLSSVVAEAEHVDGCLSLALPVSLPAARRVPSLRSSFPVSLWWDSPRGPPASYRCIW